MAYKSQQISEGLRGILDRHPSITPAETDKIAREFIATQHQVSEILTALGYPLERFIAEINARSLQVFREGTDRIGNVKKGKKKEGYRFAGLTAFHVQEFEAMKEKLRLELIDEDAFTTWCCSFLALFNYDLIEEVAKRAVNPIPPNTVGLPKYKQLRWRLSDTLANADKYRNMMVEGNLRLVAQQIRKYSFPNVEPDDIFAWGTAGLRTAINRFNPDMARFSTFAVRWIQQAIRRMANDTRFAYRIPEHKYETITKMMRAGIAPKRPEDCLPQGVSLDEPIENSGDNAAPLKDVLPDLSALHPSETLDQVDLHSTLNEQLNGLPELDRLVIALRFDMGDAAEIASSMFRKEMALSTKRGRKIGEDARKAGEGPARIRIINAPEGS